MKKIFALLFAIFSTLLFTSCQEDKPTDPPTPPPAPVERDLVNELSYQGDTIKFQSIVVDENSTPGMIVVVASKDPGLTTIEQMAEADANHNLIHKPILVIFEKESFNQTIDVATSSAKFVLSNTTGICGKVATLTNGAVDQVSAGTIKITLVGEALTVDFSLTPKDETDLFECNIKTTFVPAPIPTTNILTVDDKVSAVKSKFVLEGQYENTLYLTPSQISASNFLPDVNTYYMMLKASSYIENNTKVDITKVDEEFEFVYFNPSTTEMISVRYGDLGGATGWFKINKKASKEYAVDFEIVVGQKTYKCQFDGVFSDYMLPSEYTINSDPAVPIKSVVMKQNTDGSGPCHIYLSHVENLVTVEAMEAQGDPVKLVFNEAYLDGDVYGFFGFEEIAIEFKNKVYNNENQSAGNIKGSINGDELKLEFNIFSLSEGELAMTGYYQGLYTIIE